MKIIKYHKLNTYQYEVVLDNNERIKLYEDVILSEELLLKGYIDDLEKILLINKKYEVYEVALNYLNHHVMSIKGINDYLKKKGYSEEDIENTITRLVDNHYLDDNYYAKCYINDKVHLTNDGPLKIMHHLEENGIYSEIYEELMEQYHDIWQDKIIKYVDKQIRLNKKSNYYFKNKMLVNLMNLGYEREMINQVLNHVNIDNQDELKIKEEEKIRKKLSLKYSGEELERKIKEKLYQRGFFE